MLCKILAAVAVFAIPCRGFSAVENRNDSHRLEFGKQKLAQSKEKSKERGKRGPHGKWGHRGHSGENGQNGKPGVPGTNGQAVVSNIYGDAYYKQDANSGPTTFKVSDGAIKPLQANQVNGVNSDLSN